MWPQLQGAIVTIIYAPPTATSLIEIKWVVWFCRPIFKLHFKEF